eukprot:TRINITY_DN10744_c0_g2_i2.p1 TRINITY_DN10744_c0_g2~~TRINITY_DN10744_c0_g2_i2.p1  ORF type:complete len:278 (-),score=34.29 TRINITY_DN10744_c0_g2_i2:214-957(-)
MAAVGLGSARLRRERFQRSQGRHVLYLLGVVQAEASHHTHQPRSQTLFRGEVPGRDGTASKQHDVGIGSTGEQSRDSEGGRSEMDTLRKDLGECRSRLAVLERHEASIESLGRRLEVYWVEVRSAVQQLVELQGASASTNLTDLGRRVDSVVSGLAGMKQVRSDLVSLREFALRTKKVVDTVKAAGDEAAAGYSTGLETVRGELLGVQEAIAAKANQENLVMIAECLDSVIADYPQLRASLSGFRRR